MADLRAKLSLDGSDYLNTINRAKAANTSLSQNLHSVGSTIARVFAAQKMLQFGKYVVENAGHIKDLGEQFGITTDEVQRLQNAAQDTGLEFDDMGQALTKLGAARKDAAQGNKELEATFAKFGVTMEDIQDPTKRNLDLLVQMGNAIGKMNLNAADTQNLRELLGKAGGKLGPAIAGLGADKNAPDIAPSDIEAADKADKAFGRAKRKVTGFFTRMFTEVMGEGELDWKKGLSGKGALRSDEDIFAEINATHGGALAKKPKETGPLYPRTKKQDDEWAKWDEEFWSSDKKSKRGHHASQDAASNLVRLGNFAGVAGPGPTVNLQTASLRELKIIANNTKALLAANSTGDGISL
jgi:hypothetical protein